MATAFLKKTTWLEGGAKENRRETVWEPWDMEENQGNIVENGGKNKNCGKIVETWWKNGGKPWENGDLTSEHDNL